MRCRYEKETKIFGQPPTCELTGGVCGICNNRDYTFCLKIRELEDGYYDLLELLEYPTATKEEVRTFIKQFVKVN